MKIRADLQPLVTCSVILTCIALLLAACSWSVPSDPGLNARIRGHAPEASVSGAGASGPEPSAQAADPRARALYLDHCSRCHEPVPPGSVAAADWPRFVRRYGPRAGLFGADRARVLRWLQANAP